MPEGAGETRPVVVCLTPVKDEAWILERFLTCASLWADHILIADQGSSDDSREIAARFPKVTLIENPSPEVDEPAPQRLPIPPPPRLPRPRLPLPLDAHEAFA